jgi:DNA-binding GntR family transcriptional regulator
MTTTNLGVGLRIRDDILSGSLPLGARITIDGLATRYGVSHMPVREALRELQGEGLVVIEPNRGARVRTIDTDFVENLFEIRTALEVMLVRRAAQRCTPADIAELEAIEELLEGHIARADYAAAVSENRRFHQAINRAAHNLDALPIVDKHWMLLAALWRNYGYGASRFAGVANDHRHLIGALAARDQEAASAIMGAHAAKAKRELLRHMAAHVASASRRRKRA